MKKKLISGLLAAALTLSLAGCGAAGSAAEETAPGAAATADEAADLTGDGFDPQVDYAALAGTTITVAASPVPHAEILDVAAEILAQADITLKVMEFTDYIQPNMATESGEVDANYFQHGPYLENFNAENGTGLVSVGAIHYEPLGLYPGKTAAIDALAEGAQIGVPNDPTNEARALQLLAAQGLITLRADAGLEATKNDIEENPLGLEIVEMEAAQLPRQLVSLDMAVINGNYASEAGFSAASDALAAEDAGSEAAQTYANVLVVKQGNEDAPAVKALLAALMSQKVKDFITEQYGGAVVAIF